MGRSRVAESPLLLQILVNGFGTLGFEIVGFVGSDMYGCFGARSLQDG